MNITWTAPASAPGIGGKTFTGGKPVRVNGEDVVDFGQQTIAGKRRHLVVRLADKPDLREAVAKAEAEEEAERAAKAERLAANVPGLEELRDAVAAERDYRDGFARMMEDGNNDGVNPPKLPSVNADELRAKYPRAVVYLRAESYSFASHWAKAKAGNEAKEILAIGGALEEAEAKLKNWLSDNNVVVD